MEEEIPTTMQGATLPGDSTVALATYDTPQPAAGEVLLKVKCASICGSDIRAIWAGHSGVGAEGYRPGTIAGHEPAGIIVKVGHGMRRFQVGDRVAVYHISGCGLCHECRLGYQISCTSTTYRRAYGWQRDGGMAEYMLAEEKDLVALPPALSYADGALIACGYGTAYEAIRRIGISGADRVLITGMGPVGLSAAMIARALGSRCIIGVDMSKERLEFAEKLEIVDHTLIAAASTVARVLELTDGAGVERAIDCSAAANARLACIQAAGQRGKVALVGEGGCLRFEPSTDLLHGQKQIHGSWVTSVANMEDCVECTRRWGVHPHTTITHRFPLHRANEAYKVFASGECGKVAVCFDEELEAESLVDE